MITFYIIFSIAIIAVLVIAFLWITKGKSELQNFRMNLNNRQSVVISDGETTCKARIVRVTDTYVRVISESGRTDGVMLKNVYPLNYFHLDVEN